MARSGQIPRFTLALCGYTLLALLLFHGLFGRFSTAVPHDLGDPLLSTWILWWNSQRLPFVGPWWDGLAFFPGHGSLAFSDHRVGTALIASPIQWLGGSAVVAYNIALLSSFVLCALSAHTLTWVLAGDHRAAAVSGLIFGFNPFRISHIAHLELLVVFWLPLALAALHLYVRRYEARWLVMFAACWFLQGLSSGYYLFYSAPVIALWAVWFARDRPMGGVGAIALASAVVFAGLLPVFLGYRAVQDRLHLTRSLAEIEFFSADITGLLSATPNMALWRVPSLAENGEAEIYLGIVAPLLVALAFIVRPAVVAAGRWGRARRAVAIIGVVYALVAVSTLVGSWRISLGPVSLSASQTIQPFSVAVLSLILVGVLSPTFVAAYRRRSVFAFYLTAALLTWSFTLGPRPRFLGSQLLYRGPYALLMLLPGYDDRLRVPARFVMMTILTVAVAAGFALLRLTGSSRRMVRMAVTLMVLGAVAADSWTFALPMPTVPPFVALPDAVPSGAAVLELPLGGVGGDIAAVYRSIDHGRPVVNGYSGYEPPHYRILRPGLNERDDSILTSLTGFAPLAIVVARADDVSGSWSKFVERHEGAVKVGETATHVVYLLPSTPPPPAGGAEGTSLPIRGVGFNLGLIESQSVLDGSRSTVWATPKPQQGNEEIQIELERVDSVSGVSLATGPPLEGYPRGLTISTSIDGERWEDAWSGALGGPTFEAVLADPEAGETRLGFSPRRARFIRLRQSGASAEFAWFIADLKVFGSASR